MAIEEAGLRQQEDSLASRAQDRACRVHPAYPLDHSWIPPLDPACWIEVDRRHDHDVTRIERLHRALDVNRDAARERQRSLRLAHDVDMKSCRPRGCQALAFDVCEH